MAHHRKNKGSITILKSPGHTSTQIYSNGQTLLKDLAEALEFYIPEQLSVKIKDGYDDLRDQAVQLLQTNASLPVDVKSFP